MSKYNIVEGEKKTFLIKEIETDQNITSFSNFNEARKLVKHLNSGGGFDGNTPNFFLKVIKK